MHGGMCQGADVRPSPTDCHITHQLVATLPCRQLCRQDIRLVSNNATHVAASQREVEYLAYWNVMFSSTDPTLKDEAAWLQRGPGITVWEVRHAVRLEVLAALSCILLRLLEMRLL
jgi:hypothetical protein